MRINIPNPYGVYMHDTPEKGIFGDDFRFVSSGCVRVQDVRDYVAWLLKDNPGWSRDQIDEVIRSGQRQNVKLAQPVNVYWIYVTAWATPDGLVQFRPTFISATARARAGRLGCSGPAAGAAAGVRPRRLRARAVLHATQSFQCFSSFFRNSKRDGAAISRFAISAYNYLDIA